MSELVEKRLKDEEVIENIKTLIRLTTENSDITSTEIEKNYVRYTLDDEEKVISLKITNLNNSGLDNYEHKIFIDEIQKLTSLLDNLKELHLSGNNIFQVIPELRNLVNLEIIDLSENKLEHLPTNIYKARLVNFI